MPGRQYSQANSTYRYGFNGQEKSDDVTEGNYTAQFWEYDSRTGRRWNTDPKGNEGESLYACFGNNPILNNDPLGDVFEGVNKVSARREKQILRKTFGGSQARQLRKLFSIGKDGLTFNKIDEAKFNSAIAKISNADTRALANGYKNVINSEQTVFVNVLKGDKEVAKVENPRVGPQFKDELGAPSLILSFNGRQHNEGFGGGITSPPSEVGNYLVSFNMSASSKINYINGQGLSVSALPSAGETNSHEVLGHALGGINGLGAANKESIQATNLFLRSKGSDNYRDGFPSHAPKAMG